MIRFFLMAILFVLWNFKSSSLYSQTISATDANGAIQNLLGEGIEVMNVLFTGEPEQLSIISGAPSTLGFSDGVVITTNKRGYLQTGQNEINYTISSGTSDYHLNQINGNAGMHSRAYLPLYLNQQVPIFLLIMFLPQMNILVTIVVNITMLLVFF